MTATDAASTRTPANGTLVPGLFTPACGPAACAPACAYQPGALPGAVAGAVAVGQLRSSPGPVANLLLSARDPVCGVPSRQVGLHHFVFDAPVVAPDTTFDLPPDELDQASWVAAKHLERYLIPRMADRVHASLDAVRRTNAHHLDTGRAVGTASIS